MTNPTRVALPATVDFAFWASLMTSWLAQEAEGLLDVAQPAIWLMGVCAVCLAGGAVVTASRQPWQAGSMKLAPNLAKIIFVTMIAITAAWITFGIAFTRTPTAQTLYGICAVLSAWSAWAIFATLRTYESDNGRGGARH